MSGRDKSQLRRAVIPACLGIALALSQPAAVSALIVGYGELAVTAGEPVHLRVSTPAPSYWIDWYCLEVQAIDVNVDRTRSGSCGASEEVPACPEKARVIKRLLSTHGPFVGIKQIEPANDAYRSGFGWEITNVLTSPSANPSGFYALLLRDSYGSTFWIPVVTKPVSRGSHSRVAVLAATNTWQAYNRAGGASFYSCGQPTCTTRANVVTYNRPIYGFFPSAGGHTADGMPVMLSSLCRMRIPYELITDLDLDAAGASGDALEPYDVLVIHGHAEYWSAEMITALNSFLDRGGRLVEISGNTMYRKVWSRLDSLYRDGAWRTVIPGGEFAVLGTGYTGAGTCAPFRATNNHWVLNGTDLGVGSVFGATSLSCNPATCTSGDGASGWEWDCIGPGSPPLCDDTLTNGCIELIAKGLNRGVTGDTIGTDMYLWHRTPAGYVFGAPSITFAGSLFLDKNLQRILSNVFTVFLADTVPGPTQQRPRLTTHPRGPDVTDVSAVITSLFIGFEPLAAGPTTDVDCSGTVDIHDLSLLIDHLFVSLDKLTDCR